MKNRVVFAAAGNGKTFCIAKEAAACLADSRGSILMISYTNEGIRALENEYRNQNGGVIDERIVIKSWYSFLLSEMIKPYQCMLKLSWKNYTEQFDFEVPENYIKGTSKNAVFCSIRE